jgi:sugar-specific transcriptional regulator TrmB
MKNIENSLQKLGLSPIEVQLYSYLLKRGLSTGSELYQDNEMDKSYAYETLNSLEAKGLVYTIGSKRNKKFAPIDPDKLYEIYNQKEEEILNVKNDIADFIKDIEGYSKQNYKNKNIRILEGKNSYQEWTNAKHEAPKGSTIREFMAYMEKTRVINNAKENVNQTPLERVEKGIYMKSLTTKEEWEEINKLYPKVYVSSAELMKEMRYLPEQPKMEIPGYLVTFGNNTSLLRTKDGEFFGVIIEDKLITGLMNNMFDFMWAYSIQV